MLNEVYLSEVATIIMGQSPPSSSYNLSGVGLPFFQGVRDFGYRHPSARIFCSSPTRIANPGDILFSVRAPIGRVNVAETTIATGRGIAIIRANNPANSRYIEYFLKSKENYWDLLEGSGSVFGNATKSDLSKLLIPWPDMDVAREAIGCILGSLDDKIELNRQMCKTLEDTAQAIFKSWFIDFDPVHAKAEGKQPKGMNPAIAALFPDSFDDSHLIPKGWSLDGLDSLGTFLNGLALQKYPPTDDEWLPAIKIAQLRTNDTRNADKVSSSIGKEYIVKDGDILFSWSGSLECVLWSGGKGALNQHLFKVTSTDYPKWFVYFWIHHHLPEFRHIAAGKATTMGHIQRHHLKEAKVIIPSSNILEIANRIIDPLFENIVIRSLESKQLEYIRDLLLPQLISGSLRVSDAENIINRCR